MVFKMTIWVCALMFIATIWNVANAYSSMKDVDVHDQFYALGILDGGDKVAEFPIPAHKPLRLQEVASSQ